MGNQMKDILLGYSTSSKAFRVYNKRTKRVKENMHIDFLEDQPNVPGSTQEHDVAGSSGKDKGPTQEYILLPIHRYTSRISAEDVVQAAQDKPSKNTPKDIDVEDSEDIAEKEGQHKLTEAEQALTDELERLVAQEVVAEAMDDATRHAFEEENRTFASKNRAAQVTSINKLNTGRPTISTANTPYVSAASTPTGANTGKSSFVYLGGQIPIDASTLPNVDLPTDPNMPDLEDDYDVFLNYGIFNGAYDDEDEGAKADFNNMDNTIEVNPIPTHRIHKDNPKGQILEDPKSAVQTRGKIEKVSLAQQALFKLQKVWILVDLPYGKKAIGTKWVFKNKRDERSIVVKNKARLVAVKPRILRDSPFELEAFSDSDYGGASLDRKLTIEYVTAANCFKNPINHLRTKHIEIRYHFIRDCYEKRLIDVVKIHTDNNVADLLTKGFDVTRFNFLVMATLRYSDKHNMVTFLKKPNESVSFTEIVDFLKDTTLRTLANGTQELVASIDNMEYTITEASIRSKLQLADAAGISNLPDAEIYKGLATLGGYAGDHVPLLPAMLVGAVEDQDEVTTTGVGVGTEGAITTTSGLDVGLDSVNIHESPLRSHEAPLYEGHTLGSAEDKLQLKELMEIVPKLVTRIEDLEKELYQTKSTYGKAVLTLGYRVMSLEKTLKRKTKKVRVHERKRFRFCDPTKTISTYKRRVRSSDKGKDIGTGLDAEAEVNTSSEDFNTGSLGVSTGSGPVSTLSVVQTVNVIIPSPIKSQREGKAPMTTEEVQATKRTKAQIQQEKAGLAEAIRLQAL
ncbi:ribonuclease H-like domain-containing protein [Tanacetum coccineum]